MRYATALLILLLASSASAAQVYRWVDDQGVTHFGEQPPQGQAASSVTPKPATPTQPARLPTPEQLPAVGVSAEDAEQQRYDAEARRQAAEQEAQRKHYCEQVRTNLAQLRNNSRLRVEDEDGQLRYLSEDERQARIAESEQGIRENCRQ